MKIPYSHNRWTDLTIISAGKLSILDQAKSSNARHSHKSANNRQINHIYTSLKAGNKKTKKRPKQISSNQQLDKQG